MAGKRSGGLQITSFVGAGLQVDAMSPMDPHRMCCGSRPASDLGEHDHTGASPARRGHGSAVLRFLSDIRSSYCGYNTERGSGERSVDHGGFSCGRRFSGGGRRPVSRGAPRHAFLVAVRAAGNPKFVKHRVFSRATDGAHFAIREWLGAKRLYLHAFSFLVTVALLVYLGPFGTWASLSVPDRLLFWVATVGTNWLVGYIVFGATIRAFQTRGWPVWTGLVLAGLVTALPGTGTVWLIVAICLDYQPSDVSGIIRLYTQVFVLHLIIGSLTFHLTEKTLGQRDTDVEPSLPGERAGAASQAAPGAAILSRLSARSRADLLHLRMQDHYVEVHTAAGSELLLLRFRDALREVANVDGLQVHRSHWVARDAVAGVERRGDGRIILRLVNGNKVPVSRSFAPVLKTRGWI